MRIRKHGPADELLKDEEVMTAAKTADALAHPARIRMLRYILAENLARRSVTNKDLVNAFDYAQATVSQHLSKLIIGGLLDVKKKRTSSHYFVRIGRISAFIDTLKKIDADKDDGGLPDFLINGLLSGNEYSDDMFENMPGKDYGDVSDETPQEL